MQNYIPLLPLKAELRPFVKSVGILEVSGIAAPFRNLPNGNIQILAHLSQTQADCHEDVLHRITGPKISIIGQRTKYSIYTPAPGTRLLCIEFHPYGACAFFRCSLGDLKHLSVDVADAWFKTELLERVQGLKSDAEIFSATETELTYRLSCDPDLAKKIRIIRHAMSRLEYGKPRSVTQVALETGVQRRNLERMFREHAGISPGSYARIKRIVQAAEMIAGANGFNALDFALDRGFYDQAHFNHDFRAVVGLSPSEYAKSLKTV